MIAPADNADHSRTMTGTAVPQFFEQSSMRRIGNDTLADVLRENTAPLSILFCGA